MRGCRPLFEPEISRLLDLLSSSASRRERAFIVLGLQIGLRLKSMLSLRVGDVTIAGDVQNRIRIRRGTTKGRRAGYDVPLHPQAATALQDYLDALLDQSRDAYLFLGRRPGTRLSKTAGCGRLSGRLPLRESDALEQSRLLFKASHSNAKICVRPAR